ncbi:hypothetical protein ABES25_00180 [Bacillus gobiensis]|uniref:response regulator aspartate phosphatase n=1 Tax=Bacillus gobiensis TaxID=1441095 RepID=UPI003D19D377
MGESETVANENISSVDIADLLNEWYLRIRRHDGEGAFDYKDRVDELFPKLQDKQELESYYNLLTLKHDKTFQISKQEEPFIYSTSNSKDSKIDTMLSYYFYLNKGSKEADQGRFNSAINYYKIAELKLRSTQDEIGMAFYHLKIAILYYNLRQNLLSFNHVNDALKIFEGHQHYRRQIYTCKIVIGSNYLDIQKYELVKKYYFLALEDGKRLNNDMLVSVCFHNLALLYSKQGNTQKCLHFVEQSLKSENYRKSKNYIRTLYLLTSEKNKLIKSNEVRNLIDTGLDYCKKNSHEEFYLKFKIEKAMFEQDNSVDTFLMILSEMEEKNFLINLEDLCLDLSNYFKRKDDYKSANLFLERALYSNNLKRQKEVMG